ncbi:hypothetical protein HG536_0D03880 [Torulaspora globosa]|uniref:Zinc finger PHD-type domain-containing protein n=1 Tax=Torulaspora globosa TaxID=48254 RepID=A0A7G3ZH80_9SACH|nr:uncharacterized protein HG536_0D03880 [Torulaspora globosa]QLL32866.1 hypothetical protein HG536_0D03880 [Torulaspora globosa]
MEDGTRQLWELKTLTMEIIREENTLGEEVESPEEEEGETRCVCGEIEPPDDSGLYIQCEQCSVWQHGACVGIADGEDSHVEKYWCEQCKPELHHLYTVDSTGATRSVYKPVAEKRRLSRRSTRRGDAEAETPVVGSDQKGESADVSHSSSPSSGRSHGSRGRKASYGEDRSVDDSKADNRVSAPGSGLEGSDEAERRLQDRKRATFSAREEKQYQWMLEKAIRESRRTSQQEVEAKNSEDGHDRETDSVVGSANHAVEDFKTTSPETGLNGVAQQLEELIPAPESVSTEFSHEAVAATANTTAQSAQAAKNTSETVSRSSNSTSEDDSKRRAPSRRSKRVGNIARKSNRTNRSSSERTANGRGRNNTGARGEIGIDKPMKPRIPPQRTSLNEMRRRVSAILEFISRTQWELSESHSSKDELVRFVENQQFIEQVDSIFEKYDHSFKLMDDLTRSLLLWEKKYSRTSNLHE